MNSEAANVIVQGFLKGGFDVFDALLSRSYAYEAENSEETDAAGISGALEAAPVVMKAKILGGGGAAMLISMADAARIVALTMGEEAAKDALDDSDLGTLKEIVDGVLGGGVANLSEQFGEDVETEVIELQVDAGDGGDLAAYLGEGVVMTPFTYRADPDFDGKGFFLHSAALEARVPPTIAGGEEALVSDDEMKDILSGFSPDEEVDRMGGRGPMPDNINVILGIELTATARLGKVEMPIQEILNLGPGAIIEVGHLVDEPVELLINDHLVARGDVVVVDEKFGLRITEIISQKERIENLR